MSKHKYHCERCRKATMSVADMQLLMVRLNSHQMHTYTSARLCQPCRSKMVDRFCEFVDEITAADKSSLSD